MKMSRMRVVQSTGEFDSNGYLRDRYKALANIDPGELEFEANMFIGQIRSIVFEIGKKSITAKARRNKRVQFVNSVKKAAASARLLDRIAWLELAHGNDRAATDLIRKFRALQELSDSLIVDVDNIVLTEPRSLAADALLQVFEMYHLNTPDSAGSFASQCLAEILRCAGFGETEHDEKDGRKLATRSTLKSRKAIRGKK